jgi:hypothetical protein
MAMPGITIAPLGSDDIDVRWDLRHLINSLSKFYARRVARNHVYTFAQMFRHLRYGESYGSV